jgi:glucosyltransferase Lgt1/2/3
MNFENQTRLIKMREQNPNDPIHLIYDSTLLNEKANKELLDFCTENDITPIDADQFKSKVKGLEAELYQFYKDEIQNLSNGGNLGVASDILRWLRESYLLGSYTDLDVPLNTNGVPKRVDLKVPLLLNIGSLKLLGNMEMLIVLNEYIALAEGQEQVAQKDIDRVHAGILEKLENYQSDYIEETEKALGNSNFLNRVLLGYMKNRAESLYIKLANDLRARALNERGGRTITSRELRGYANRIMSNPSNYLDFKRKQGEENQDVIKRLRNELRGELGFIKWLFFRSEYKQIQRQLKLSDTDFIDSMMKKEKSLYIKSIVVCTTGPISVAKSFFGTYVMTKDEVNEKVVPVAFSHYNLDKAFLSNNVIPMHQNAWGMLRYLGVDVGVLNDSSWLEEGMALQNVRQSKLLESKQDLEMNLPQKLAVLNGMIAAHLRKLEADDKGLFSFIFKSRRTAKIEALKAVMGCFDENQSFDIKQFRKAVSQFKPNVFDGSLSRETEYFITTLEELCHEAIVLRVARDKKLHMDPKFANNPMKDMLIPSVQKQSDAPETAPVHSKVFSEFVEPPKQGAFQSSIEMHLL